MEEEVALSFRRKWNTVRTRLLCPPHSRCASLHLLLPATTWLINKGQSRGGPSVDHRGECSKKGPVYSSVHANIKSLLRFCLLPDPGEEVQHRHRFLKEGGDGGDGGRRWDKAQWEKTQIEMGGCYLHVKWEHKYLSGSHLAKDVPEAKCFISSSRHYGLPVRRHGLHINSLLHTEETAL